MATDLEKLKKIYLATDIDSDDYEDNLKQITEWESSLRQNEDFGSWQSSDVTKSVILQAKKAYKDHAMRLVEDRTLTEMQRQSIWAKQDACVFLLSLVEKDVKSALAQINNEIKQALSIQ